MQTGELSSLYILYDFQGEQIKIQITSDCTIVLYPNIVEIKTELEIVESVIDWLHSVNALFISGPRKSKKPKMTSTNVEQMTENPAPLFEVLGENGL